MKKTLVTTSLPQVFNRGHLKKSSTFNDQRFSKDQAKVKESLTPICHQAEVLQ